MKPAKQEMSGPRAVMLRMQAFAMARYSIDAIREALRAGHVDMAGRPPWMSAEEFTEVNALADGLVLKALRNVRISMPKKRGKK